MTYGSPSGRVDPATLRPGRIWYWVAGAIVVLGVCLGPGIAVLGFTALPGALPTMKHQFDPNKPTRVQLSSDRDWAIYVRAPQQAIDAHTRVTCRSDDRWITLSRSTIDVEFDHRGYHWQLVYDVSVDRSGTYQISCSSDDPRLHGEKFAIGEALNVQGVVGRILGSLGALLGIPCLALLIAGVIALVTALRRNSHKRQIEQQMAESAGQAPPGRESPHAAPPGPGVPPPGPPSSPPPGGPTEPPAEPPPERP